MAIKKRTAARPEDIEKFVAAAEQPVATVAPEPQPKRKPAPKQSWPKTLLIRYPDESLPQALAELSELEERSLHATAVRALRRGLEELTREARS